MNLKHTIKRVLREEVKSKYGRPNEMSPKFIYKFLNSHFADAEHKITPKSRFYGNLREDICVSGIEELSAIFYFDNNKFSSGFLSVSKGLIKTISELFYVRPSFIMSTIQDWYEDTLLPKFEQKVGETGLYITDESTHKPEQCIPEPKLPEGITNEEMIEFIRKNTAYSMNDIINKLETGERDLEDFYLDIVDTVEHKKRLGF